jgi:hypothetical protein
MPGTLSLDPFVANGYSLLEMTEAINRLPYNVYSRTLELGLFQEEPITVPVVSVEERGGTLNLLPSIVRGAPHLVNRSAKRKLKTFAVPQIVLDDVVLPSEVAGVRAFGTGNQVDTVASKVTQKLQEMRTSTTSRKSGCGSVHSRGFSWMATARPRCTTSSQNSA